MLDVCAGGPPQRKPCRLNGLRARPCPRQRLAEPFEALRDRAEAQPGGRPGRLPRHARPDRRFHRPRRLRPQPVRGRRAWRRRAAMASRRTAPPTSPRWSRPSPHRARGSPASAARMRPMQQRPARPPRRCSQAGATVWLAGRPGELEAQLKQAGVSGFVYAGCDAVAVLDRALPLPRRAVRFDASSGNGDVNAIPSHRPDDRRLGFQRRRRHPGRSQDLCGASGLWRQRHRRADGAEHPRRQRHPRRAGGFRRRRRSTPSSPISTSRR